MKTKIMNGSSVGPQFWFDPAVTTYVKSYFENFVDIVEHKVGESKQFMYNMLQ